MATKKIVSKLVKKVEVADPTYISVSVAKMKMPTTLAAKADMLFVLQQQRFAAANALKSALEMESTLREFLINNISKSDASGVVGKRVRATIKTKQILTIENEEAYMKFANRKGNEDLLSHKPNMKAVEERWEDKKKVPGVGVFNVVSVSLNKL